MTDDVPVLLKQLETVPEGDEKDYELGIILILTSVGILPLVCKEHLISSLNLSNSMKVFLDQIFARYRRAYGGFVV